MPRLLPVRAAETQKKSILDRFCVKILFDHESNLENDCIVKLPQIKPGELFNLFKSVNQRVPVDKKLP